MFMCIYSLISILCREGKSIILGATSVMLALLGFRVRTVCYSEYLSNRDFELFKEVFDRFGVTEHITYSKITAFAEDSTAAKGNIRHLTESLLRGKLSTPQSSIIPPRRCLDDETLAHNHTTSNEGSNQKILTGSSSDESHSVSKETHSNHDDSITSDLTESKKTSASTLSQQLGPKKVQGVHLPAHREDILVVDEVDVLFGSNFYGELNCCDLHP